MLIDLSLAPPALNLVSSANAYTWDSTVHSIVAPTAPPTVTSEDWRCLNQDAVQYCEERRMKKRALKRGYPVLPRTNVYTQTYIDAVGEVARRHDDVVCVDLFARLLRLAGGQDDGEPLPGSLDQPENEVLKTLVLDDVYFHPSPEGYNVLDQVFNEAIIGRWPDLDPRNIPYAFLAWDDTDAWKHGEVTYA
ncbi:hypothetical protein PG994_006876 [Apiospora phragmitis]|uniref:Uncharacterized protein n=1 Tax=Apiospora phragmitis TaxID=2905665 RepID=A0ABR1VGE2_9PEZI